MSIAEREQLMDADELAERWRISKAAVYRLARTSQIPSVPLGRYVRFRRASIETWEIEQEAKRD